MARRHFSLDLYQAVPPRWWWHGRVQRWWHHGHGHCRSGRHRHGWYVVENGKWKIHLRMSLSGDGDCPSTLLVSRQLLFATCNYLKSAKQVVPSPPNAERSRSWRWCHFLPPPPPPPTATTCLRLPTAHSNMKLVTPLHIITAPILIVVILLAIVRGCDSSDDGEWILLRWWIISVA